ncbi:hypothetical protein A2866_02455 [Candidatus Roizmanbacteria bacterium RIFCSPHIGHO2_01_FULL_39_8]|uniref:Uncharacterized protein n=2 Tax=Candidatus Roizmaniibacteriota TaxID=1752723 RepID=A0A1F7GT36_9BACT|nr:MAG: hypothetical protein A2866_02455 [Candidatus Roizmanbacteria bacterium RIFCSPHIGHO2_01_FULL_39_8]OGK25266.1 MAG: hypothetical protein A3C28_00020 [Candidatus Roizmanbacteria bacterium RIFCSPHIGHO2_02_FULL_39_9]
MKQIYWENLIKNIIILILLVPSYLSIQNFIQSSGIDQTSAGSLLVAVSILAVTACFGNFAFTYEKVDHKDTGSRILAHITTGLLMLLIGISLEMTAILAVVLIGNFHVFNLSLVILYLASVLYDFWDLKRSNI